MKERPILFTGEMVRAILEGRKTQTRRVMKQRKRKDGCKLIPEVLQEIGVGAACPYGKVGDRLWVREAFSAWTPGDPVEPIESEETVPYKGCEFEYRATSEAQPERWRPSIHMPRWASRINLEITEVRVERVQDISDEDADAEGVDSRNVPTGGDDFQDYWRDYSKPKGDEWPWIEGDPRHSFRTLWDSINAKRGYSWDSNPWVWVVEFKRLTT